MSETRPSRYARGRKTGEAPKTLAVKLPNYWTTTSGVNIIPDASMVPEFQDLLNRTWRAVITRDRKDQLPSGTRVLNVLRVENHEGFSRYWKHLVAVRERRGHMAEFVVETKDFLRPRSCEAEHSTNALYLFHGTNPNAADGIAKSGFRIDLAGSAVGTMCGPGLYLAEHASKSDEYAKEGDGIFVGQCALLVCRAIAGKVFTTTMKGNCKDKVMSREYDSVCADRLAAVGTFREMIFYDSAGVYAEFIVIYSRCFDTVGGGSVSPSKAVTGTRAVTTRRPKCKYGKDCTRKNPEHKKAYCHPGEPDWEDLDEREESEELLHEVLTDAREEEWEAVKAVLQSIETAKGATKRAEFASQKPKERQFGLIHHAAFQINRDILVWLVDEIGVDVRALTKDSKTFVDVLKQEMKISGENDPQLLSWAQKRAAGDRAAPLPKIAFAQRSASKFMKFSSDGLSVTHTGSTLCGVVFTDAPIPEAHGGRKYFEVRIDEVDKKGPDGMAIGVSTENHGKGLHEPFEDAFDIKNSWSFGYDGLASLNGEERSIEWQPQHLKKGDRVGLLVEGGKLTVVHNGAYAFKPFAIPSFEKSTKRVGGILYPFVDLLECVRSLSILPDAVPPQRIRLASQRAQSESSSEGEDVGSSKVKHLPIKPPSSPLSPVKKTHSKPVPVTIQPPPSPRGGYPSGSSSPSSSGPAPRGRAAALGQLARKRGSISCTVMNAFDKSIPASNVKLSSDGLTARHLSNRGDDDAFCVVYGNGSMPKLPGEDGEPTFYFEVELVARREDYDDCGLVLGFTDQNPANLTQEGKEYEYPCEVPESWSVGYEGMCFVPGEKAGSQTGCKEFEINFDPTRLRAGDRVGIYFDWYNIVLFVNGEEVEIIDSRIGYCRKVRQLWPLVGLVGAALEVKLLPNAEFPLILEPATGIALLGRE